MINMYKYIRSPYSELGVELFTLRSTQKTRGHSLHLEEMRFNLQTRKGFFTVRAENVEQTPSRGGSGQLSRLL